MKKNILKKPSKKMVTQIILIVVLFLSGVFWFYGNVETNNDDESVYYTSVVMSPTISSGNVKVSFFNDDVLEDTIQRQDIIYYKIETSDSYGRKPGNYISRVIGLPGETVTLESDGTVTINGDVLNEPYIENKRESRGSFTQVVPTDSYLLLGDGRGSGGSAPQFVIREQILGIVKL